MTAIILMAAVVVGFFVGRSTNSHIHRWMWGEKGMKRRTAKKRLREIWKEDHPGCAAIEEIFKTPEPWRWFDIYANLRNREQTVEMTAKVFTEAITKRNHQINLLSVTIHQQRAELKKRLKELEALKPNIEPVDSRNGLPQVPDVD